MGLRVGMVSLHTSPDGEAGSGDVGGMNVVVLQTALALARLGRAARPDAMTQSDGTARWDGTARLTRLGRPAQPGYTVEMLTRRTSPSQPSAVTLAPGVVLRRLDAGPAAPRTKAEHEQFIPEFSAQLARLEPYDILHAHHWFSGIAALPVARRQGVPLVQSFHSIAADPSTPLSAGERPESPGRLAGEARLARESCGIIAVSRAERATAIERLGAPEGRVWPVPPGVDAALFRPARPGERAPLAGPYLLLAARLEPLKGVDTAIRMLAALPARQRPRLVVCGGATSGYEAYPARLRLLAERAGVADRVSFPGPQSRRSLARLMRHARAVLVPSHSETFGLIALEAQASGTPVVAARAGGLAEAVDDGRTGLLVGDHDPQHWAHAVAGLLRSAAWRRQLGEAGRARSARFTWERTARGMLACYRTARASVQAGAGAR